jgi:hypothetical protein
MDCHTQNEKSHFLSIRIQVMLFIETNRKMTIIGCIIIIENLLQMKDDVMEIPRT